MLITTNNGTFPDLYTVANNISTAKAVGSIGITYLRFTTDFYVVIFQTAKNSFIISLRITGNGSIYAFISSFYTIFFITIIAAARYDSLTANFNVIPCGIAVIGSAAINILRFTTGHCYTVCLNCTCAKGFASYNLLCLTVTHNNFITYDRAIISITIISCRAAKICYRTAAHLRRIANSITAARYGCINVIGITAADYDSIVFSLFIIFSLFTYSKTVQIIIGRYIWLYIYIFR